MSLWSTQKSKELYRVEQWGLGYFDINETGNVIVRPARESPFHVDLKLLIDELRQRKIEPPILIRFMDILQDRIKNLHDCFKKAILDLEYQGNYVPIFPIKVNQQKHVIEGILRYGKKYGIGLEAGSKPELLAVLALVNSLDAPIICNGYKDGEFIELVCTAHKMGKNIIPVIEKFSELEAFIANYKKTGVIPKLGLRVKLFTKGAGQWAFSGGENSKFGLRISELMEAVSLLKREGLIQNLKLIHFHIGSQVTRINIIKRAMIETGRVFVELYKEGVPLEYIDIGGGLGVDYHGQEKNSFSSINYNLMEYANDVVYRLSQLCKEEGIPHPTIFSESGRFLSAHYSLLVTNVSTVSVVDTNENLPPLPEDAPGPMQEMYEILDLIDNVNFLECYHDAVQYKTESLNLFNLGYLSLRYRSIMEKIFWAILKKIRGITNKLEKIPLELKSIEEYLADTYFANFSLFQSLPDSWALNQVFPVIPVHQLDQRPDRNVTIADLTCDSDGKIDDYIGAEKGARYIPMHAVREGDTYYIGIFLVGAYQETLGDMHNLFGDTNAVQVEITGPGEYKIGNIIKGDTVKEVLEYVAFSANDLIEKMRAQTELAVREKRLTIQESTALMDLYENGMAGYTYLED